MDYKDQELRTVLLYGNAVNGFDVIGPFDTWEDAEKWIDSGPDGAWEGFGDVMSIARLNVPHPEGDGFGLSDAARAQKG
jgi:hypothetical protein